MADAVLTRRVLEETDRRSPRYIWGEVIEPKLVSLRKETDSDETRSAESAKNDVITGESGKSSTESVRKKSGMNGPVSVPFRVPLRLLQFLFFGV